MKQKEFKIKELWKQWRAFKKDPVFKHHPQFIRDNFQMTLVYFYEDVENKEHKDAWTIKDMHQDMLDSLKSEIEENPGQFDHTDEKILKQQIASIVDDFKEFVEKKQETGKTR